MNNLGTSRDENLRLTILKVGGSLITHKDKSFESNIENIRRISREISTYMELKGRDERLIIVHGQGSYAHLVAINQITRLHSIDELNYGLLLVMWAARALNSRFVEGLVNYGVRAFPVQTSISFQLTNGKVSLTGKQLINRMLEKDWVPIFYGDILVDTVTDKTQVFSSENIISELCNYFSTERIIISTDKPGVLENVKDLNSTISVISDKNLNRIEKLVSGSSNTDVTGGMKHKVETLMKLYQEKKINSYIIDGTIENGILDSLLKSKYVGTKVGE